MIRLIATDLDGTIINSANECHPSTVEEIKRLRGMGVRFCVCSGRPLDSVVGLLKGWGLENDTDYLIGSNGGEVMELATGKRAEAYPLSPELLRELWDIYEPLGLIPTYQIGMDLYLPVITPQAEIVAHRVGINLIQQDVRTMDIEQRIKTLFILNPEDMEKAERYAAEHPDPRYIAFKTAPDLFEMTHPMLAKDVGVQIVAAMMHITPNEIMTFGDTTNDIRMLEYARYGICVANGTDDAKAAAFDIAPAMEEQGFAKYLRQHLQTPEYK
ncbi:MAG: HAD family phosphatase [Erysipelotrichaceae bacterium]|nr:HAD family phosphatase [Erysipelotrichaceae bacterium]